MTKKTTPTDDNYEDTNDGTDALAGMDFNVTDDYKPEPLIPNGTYHGAITNVTFNQAGYNIAWDVCLHDNGGVMNDGETPIDGAYVQSMSWLPKPDDANLYTGSGKWTKKQWKINALAEQFQDLEINAQTPADISEAIENAEWVGIEVSVTLENEEYKGKARTKVVLGGLKKSTMF